MILGDFHTHSTLDDGKSTLAEMVSAARALGLTRLGLSGHSWCPMEEDFCIPREGVPGYLEEARALREQYAGELEIFVGMELDYYGQRPEGLDYGIGSVHGLLLDGQFYPVDESPEKSRQAVEEQFGGDWYRYTDAYYDLVADLPQKTGCDWIGHFDLVTKFNEGNRFFDPESPRLRALALEALEALAPRDVIFEVNTGAISRGWRSAPYPAAFLLKEMRRRKARVCITGDSHAADALLTGFGQAKALLEDCGFSSCWYLTEQGFQEGPLPQIP